MKKILARICRFCPVCILRRRFPESRYGRFTRRIERACPFCRAYDELYGPKPAPWPPNAGNS